VSILDVLMIWASSVEQLVSSKGASVTFGRSQQDRPNASAWVTISHGAQEAELLLWESGEAEYAYVAPDGEMTQEHYDDIDDSNLGGLLARLLELVSA
jgi:hypothetical protein